MIGAFLVQTLLRLILSVSVYRLGYLTPVVHVVTVVAAFTVCGLLLAGRADRGLLRLTVTVLIATVWTLLIFFDANALLASRLQFQPLSLNSLAVFYCERKSLGECFWRYSDIILSVVGSLILMSAFLTVLLSACSSEIYAWASAVYNKGNQLTRTWLRLSLAPLLKLVCIAYAVLWIVDPRFLAKREPIAWMFYLPPFEHGPKELAALKRPAFKIEPSPDVHPRTLVLIVVDSLRADAIDLDRDGISQTPNLRSLAESGKLYDLGPAAAICTSSFCGIVGIQSGSSWATLQRGPPIMLADALASNGYQNHLLLSGPHLTMANMREIYGPNVRTLLDDLSPDSGGLLDDREQVRRLAELHVTDALRTFIAIHLMSAHALGLRFETGHASREGSRLRSAMLGDYPRYYSSGVKQADHIIGELFAVLKAKGLLDDAIVVITADHGERLDGKNKQGHGGDFDAWTTRVPLLVYDSNARRWPKRPIVSQADLAPTLLDVVGIEVPASWDGRSLMRLPPRIASPVDSAFSTGLVGVLQKRTLLFRCNLKSGDTRVDAFDGSFLDQPADAFALRFSAKLYASLPRRRDAPRCFLKGGS